MIVSVELTGALLAITCGTWKGKKRKRCKPGAKVSIATTANIAKATSSALSGEHLSFDRVIRAARLDRPSVIQ
jgi:hypothetical protein